jgi:hypothetical protein
MHKRTFGLLTAFFTLCFFKVAAQSEQQEKMALLSFMVGDWVGTSRSFKEGETIAVPAYETIQYKIDQHIITIDLLSETLLIHTVIYYDPDEATYYYCPYYKNGAAKYRGEFKDGKFLVWFNESRRLTFHLTPQGEFQEYGENLIDGQWQKYFEDTFKTM